MKLYLIGGFLGSGKTTAIINACQSLMKNDSRVAVITNDQGDQQVDSASVKSLSITNAEVGNGCFCCNYDQLRDHIHRFDQSIQPDIIFTESVGSCTDLIATITKPYSIAAPDSPVVISIFADALLLLAFLEERASFINDNVRYIYKKQLEEADILIINKIDLLYAEQLKIIEEGLAKEYGSKTILYQNSLDESSIQNWLNAADQFIQRSDRSSLDLDYNLYGDGEAQLTWLDKSITVTTSRSNAVEIVNEIMHHIHTELKQKHLIVGHLKFFVEAPSWQKKVSITTISSFTGYLPEEGKINYIRLLINARVQTDPSTLKQVVNDVLVQMTQQYECNILVEKWTAFKPGFPKPLHRIS